MADLDDLQEGTENDPLLHINMKAKREGISLSIEEIEQVLLDIGYKVVPHRARLDLKQYAVGRGFLETPPLSVAVAAFANDYHDNSPYPAYAVTCLGTVADFKDDDDVGNKRAISLLRMRESGEIDRLKPTHTQWIARAYAEERGCKPDSHEAIVWARKEVDNIMTAIDKALKAKGARPPERIKTQI